MTLSLEELMGGLGMRIPEIVNTAEEAQDGDSVIAEDGIYKLVRTLIGDFWIKDESFKNKKVGKPQMSESFVQSTEFPKIPGELFYGIIRFYRKIYETNKNEVMAQIWWDKAEEKFLVEVPEQEVSGAAISYQRTGGWYEDPNKVLILTSHSHHTMGAFYSGTDNSDEKGKHGIYSFVFGNLVNQPDGSFTFKTVQRACCADALIPLQLEDIFDFYEGCEFKFDIPESEYAKVKAKVYTYNYGAYANYGKNKSFPQTGNPSAPANVKKVKIYDYDDYDYYGGSDVYGDWANRSFNNGWDGYGAVGNDASEVEKDWKVAQAATALESRWRYGAEAALDKKSGRDFSGLITGLFQAGDQPVFTKDEINEIEVKAREFVNSFALPKEHPMFAYTALLGAAIEDMVDSLDRAYCGERNSDLKKVEEASKMFVLTIAKAIETAESACSYYSGIDGELIDVLENVGINHLYLPERIASYIDPL